MLWLRTRLIRLIVWWWRLVWPGRRFIVLLLRRRSIWLCPIRLRPIIVRLSR